MGLHPHVGKRVDSRDVRIAKDEARHALERYAEVLHIWNAPDNAYSKRGLHDSR